MGADDLLRQGSLGYEGVELFLGVALVEPIRDVLDVGRVHVWELEDPELRHGVPQVPVEEREPFLARLVSVQLQDDDVVLQLCC